MAVSRGKVAKSAKQPAVAAVPILNSPLTTADDAVSAMVKDKQEQQQQSQVDQQTQRGRYHSSSSNTTIVLRYRCLEREIRWSRTRRKWCTTRRRPENWGATCYGEGLKTTVTTRPASADDNLKPLPPTPHAGHRLVCT